MSNIPPRTIPDGVQIVAVEPGNQHLLARWSICPGFRDRLITKAGMVAPTTPVKVRFRPEARKDAMDMVDTLISLNYFEMVIASNDPYVEDAQ